MALGKEVRQLRFLWKFKNSPQAIWYGGIKRSLGWGIY